MKIKHVKSTTVEISTLELFRCFTSNITDICQDTNTSLRLYANDILALMTGDPVHIHDMFCGGQAELLLPAVAVEALEDADGDTVVRVVNEDGSDVLRLRGHEIGY